MTADTSNLDMQPDSQQPDWKEWVRVALIGSSRAELPPSLHNLLTTQGLCGAEEEAPEQILLTAGSQQLLQRVADAGAFFRAQLPTVAPVQQPAIVPPASIRLLDAILTGQYPEALREYLHLLVKWQDYFVLKLYFLIFHWNFYHPFVDTNLKKFHSCLLLL